MIRDLTGKAKTGLIRTNLVNHVLLLVDASGSMGSHVKAVRQQLAELIEDLKEQSVTLDQETRLTVYIFSSEVRCIVWDTDVLRTPPIERLYELMNGMTALNDAAAIGIDDMNRIPTLYGDHAFLAYLITDGLENDSRMAGPDDVAVRIQSLSDTWTFAAFVPNPSARRYAVQHMGVPADNVAMWANGSREGFVQAASVMRSATRGYMAARATGQRSTRTLFSTGSEAVNTKTVALAVNSSALAPVGQRDYRLLAAQGGDIQMDELFDQAGIAYRDGRGYYEWHKTENVQPYKKIAVVRKATGEVFMDDSAGSPGVRDLIGLSKTETVSLRPNFNPEFTIFVQSTRNTRKIRNNRHALVLL